MSPAEGAWLRAGVVGRPHGLDGSFHVAQANPRLLASTAELLVSGELRAIERRAGHDARVILRLAGCEDRDAAEALRGSELLVAREGAPRLEAGEWWAEDLEGCAVGDGAKHVGVVRRLLGLPSCELLEVEREEGSGDLLVPLIGDAVRDVDIRSRHIDIDLEFLGESGAGSGEQGGAPDQERPRA